MAWVEGNNDDSLNDDDSIDGLGDEGKNNEGAWEYKLTRDFRAEVEDYLARMERKKMAGKTKKAEESVPHSPTQPSPRPTGDSC